MTETQEAALLNAAEALLDWFKEVPGAMSSGELLKAGCPNHLAADVWRLRRALAWPSGGALKS